MTKNLVAYFSASGLTKGVAKNLADAISADIVEIKPKVPYTKGDLDWMDKNSRSSIEMRDKTSRPEIENIEINAQDYDVIFLGFPIWWYIAPTIINTFLEKFDFSNKKIILFGTSGGSSFGKTVENLKGSVSETTKFIEGKIINPHSTSQELKEWAESLL